MYQKYLYLIRSAKHYEFQALGCVVDVEFVEVLGYLITISCEQLLNLFMIWVVYKSDW